MRIVNDGPTDHLKIFMHNCRATRECHVEYQKPVAIVKDIYAYYLYIFFLAARQNKVFFKRAVEKEKPACHVTTQTAHVGPC